MGRAPENSLHPCDDFVGTGVGGLVEVDDTGGDVTLDVALQRRSTARDGGEVAGADKKFVIVLEEETVYCGAATSARVRREVAANKEVGSYGN